MKKTKTQKGITLIALIITIVVLLILAVVAIRAINGDGVIQYTQNAATGYEDAQLEEQSILAQYEYQAAKAAGTTTAETLDAYILETKYNGAKIGDYVQGYDEHNQWQILGTENGKLLLVANKDFPLNDRQPVSLKGSDGYANGLAEIEEACQNLLNTTYASEVRNITLNDINKITGYDPNKALFKHDVTGEVGRYGNTVSYRMGTTYVQYTNLAGTWVDADELVETAPENELNTTFTKLDGTSLSTEPLKVTSNYYRYTLSDYVKDENLLTLLGGSYWISDKYEYARFGRVVYGIFSYNMDNNGRVDGGMLYDTKNGDGQIDYLRVKPVVVLKDGVELEETSNTLNAPANTWSIKK